MLVDTWWLGEGGAIEAARILSPTAQNEAWLAELLTTALAEHPEGGEDARRAAERAIRTADPCLPCTLAPEGHMPVEIVR